MTTAQVAADCSDSRLSTRCDAARTQTLLGLTVQALAGALISGSEIVI